MPHLLLIVLSMSSTAVFAHDGPFYSVEHLDAILWLGFVATATIVAGLPIFDRSTESISTRVDKYFRDKNL